MLIPLAAGLFMPPFFLCSATAGQLADEMDKGWLIRLIKLLEIPVRAPAIAAGALPPPQRSMQKVTWTLRPVSSCSPSVTLRAVVSHTV